MKDESLSVRAPLALIIDDDEAMRLLARVVLEQCGLRVIEAESGTSGLAAFSGDTPDIVLLDVQMPGKDGFAVCSELRAMSAGQHVPILMMTGLNDVESIDRAYQSGATDFIQKPINWPILGYRVRYMLRASRSFEQLAKLSRIQKVLSGINSALVRIHDCPQLFKEVCHIAVEHGQFMMVWIGLVQPDTHYTSTEIWAGHNDGYLEAVGCGSHHLPEGVAKLALLSGKAIIVNDIKSDSRVKYKKEALSRGYGSMVILPLQVENQSVGLIAFYAAAPGYFTDDEMRLLNELAGDVSFALNYISKEEKLDYLAYYDALTELPNRTLFCDRANQQVNAAKKDCEILVVIYIELERFRNVNDTLGRQAGDSLLKLAAERLKTAVVEPHLVACTGPDSFTILLVDVKDESDSLHLLERTIIPLFQQPFTVDGTDLRISIRSGIALFPNDGDNADTLLINAKTALNKATASGERYLFYTPQMNDRVAGKLFLENKLGKALEEKQFVLYYQPKVDLMTGHINGLEGLIRWNDPERGMVPPSEFIPLLEETGLILDVGEWVIRKSMEDYRRWQAAGLQPPRIAVNVSSIQLRHKDFVTVVQQVIGADQMNVHGLDLEITESLIMEDVERNIMKLAALRDMNVLIAIDDFGTGYSSLAYVAKLPIDILKIDRAFIVDIENSVENRAIVSTIILLAHSLNLKVVAEGVETKKQAQLLRSLECDQMQGYLFSPPVSSEQIEAMLAQQCSARSC
ncbi:putative Diguanylate cyclase [Candidatus Nitrotoga sp. BS]|uniref:EAL domain-containing protein n=1 Tax=Candidatus Nitrotoga sp. BS TaxID=2890408 RepID=UPI001EF166FB|nr:EAL domain-containing protein [Candidatus Nitrotoga sp. BS]CAH1208608.1 putative Diguanylate cyclase [Candidatus Nitrotoga sp. BS]